jgi:hypothetical protein
MFRLTLHGMTIPTCVGITEAKTPAKLANAVVKKQPSFGGVVDLCGKSHLERDDVMLNRRGFSGRR